MNTAGKAPLLCIALDGLAEQERETLQIAADLSSVFGPKIGFKLNLDYLLSRGIHTAIANVRQYNHHPIFADLKMWNGGRTMATAVRELVNMGVDYLTVYALADDELTQAVATTKNSATKVLGVTVLTHFNEQYCIKHFKRSFRDTVRHLAETALERGCHGLILPGTSLDVVDGLDTLKGVPGIRPGWYQDTRHEQEVEPALAVQGGANLLVCGSPVTKSSDPVSAGRQLLAEIEEASE